MKESCKLENHPTARAKEGAHQSQRGQSGSGLGQISRLQDCSHWAAKTQARGDAAPSRLRRHGAGVGARARQGPPRQASLLRSLRRCHRRLRFLLFVRPGRARRRAQRSPLSFFCHISPRTFEQCSRSSFIPCCCLELAPPICPVHLIVWRAAASGVRPPILKAACQEGDGVVRPLTQRATAMVMSSCLLKCPQGKSALLAVLTQQRNCVMLVARC